MGISGRRRTQSPFGGLGGWSRCVRTARAASSKEQERPHFRHSSVRGCLSSRKPSFPQCGQLSGVPAIRQFQGSLSGPLPFTRVGKPGRQNRTMSGDGDLFRCTGKSPAGRCRRGSSTRGEIGGNRYPRAPNKRGGTERRWSRARPPGVNSGNTSSARWVRRFGSC